MKKIARREEAGKKTAESASGNEIERKRVRKKEEEFTKGVKKRKRRGGGRRKGEREGERVRVKQETRLAPRAALGLRARKGNACDMVCCACS